MPEPSATTLCGPRFHVQTLWLAWHRSHCIPNISFYFVCINSMLCCGMSFCNLFVIKMLNAANVFLHHLVTSTYSSCRCAINLLWNHLFLGWFYFCVGFIFTRVLWSQKSNPRIWKYLTSVKGWDTEIAPKILRLSKLTDMTIHWNAGGIRFLIQPFSGEKHFLNFSQRRDLRIFYCNPSMRILDTHMTKPWNKITAKIKIIKPHECGFWGSRNTRVMVFY
jgi:hypothetical protein